MKRIYIFLPLILLAVAGAFYLKASESDGAPVLDRRALLSEEMEQSLKKELLAPWYPRAVDEEFGGFLSTFTYDWQPTGPQDKMIVTQARHVWTNAKAAQMYPEVAHYSKSAEHGLAFLREVMWDSTYGGFHTLVDRQGRVKSKEGERKTAYGNSFGIYALAAYYKAFQDTSALNLAKETFRWLEENSHDPVHKGYFQHMALDGTPLKRGEEVPSTSDLGYKDQNSSIHLLEAFTELYSVWPDPVLAERLEEMLYLVRDTITTDKGYMVLFFEPDWTPVTFRDSSEAVIEAHHYLDHVSFGHDVETAYLMLEASHALGLEDDTTTLAVGKRMVDHALRNGWDPELGGFYDGGYYFKGEEELKVVKDSKNWWSQAEGLNSLLLMADLYPEDQMAYGEKFEKLWDYTQEYLIDHKYGGWYQGGLDVEPEQRTALKGQIWKAAYHNYRALENCVLRLRGETVDNE